MRTPREAVEILRWNSLHNKWYKDRAEDVLTVCDEYDWMVGQISVLKDRVDRLTEFAEWCVKDVCPTPTYDERARRANEALGRTV
jgi:hypothetical protein